MDPLSFTASLIAVVGALATAFQSAQRLVSLKNAPMELIALLNEVTALRSLLRVITRSVDGLQDLREINEAFEDIQALLRPVKDHVQQLDNLTQYQLKRNEEYDRDGRPKVARLAWLRRGPDLSRLRQDIRDTRGNLQTAMTAVNLMLGRRQYNTIIQVQRVSLGTAKEVGGIREQQYTHTYALQSAMQQLVSAQGRHSKERQVEDVSDVETVTAYPLRNSKGSGISANNGITTRRPPSPYFRDAFSITTIFADQSCTPYCSCQCHVRNHTQTPGWLKTVIGAFIMDYTGTSLLRTTPCNYPKCRSQGRGSSRLVYYFPTWMMQRVLCVSGTFRGLTGAGASWTLRMPRLVPHNFTMWPMIERSMASEVKRILGTGEASIFDISTDGDICLHYAVQLGRREMCSLLLQQGADQSARNNYRQTPAFLAREMYQSNDFDDLLDTSHVTEDANYNSVHLAVLGQGSLSVKQQLQLSFADIDARDHWGRTSLMIAAARGKLEATSALLEWKADTLLRDFRGRTALHCAAEVGTSEAAEVLIKSGAPINLKDTYGRSAIAVAAVEDNSDVFRVLLQHKAHLRYLDTYQQSLLHHVARHSTARIMRLLALADLKGIDPLARDQVGGDAVEYFEIRSVCGDGRKVFLDIREAFRELMASASRQHGVEVDLRALDVEHAYMSDGKAGTADGE